MRPVDGTNPTSQSLPGQVDPSPSLFDRVLSYFQPRIPPPSSCPVQREITHLNGDNSRECDDKKEARFKPVIPVAVEALQIRPAPPMFVPYTIKIELLPDEMKNFEVATLEQEEIVMKELAVILDEASGPVEVHGGLPQKRFAEIMKSFEPHHMRVRELFEQKFSIYEVGQYSEAIGPKIAKEKDRGDGITEITYRNGRVKTVLQPYSEARHPWARRMLEKGMELPLHAIEQLRQAMPKLMEIDTNSKKASPDGVRLFDGANMIFSLDAVPDVVFKRANEGYAVMMKDSDKGNKDTAKRFEKMVEAQFVCQALGLDLLVVPSARKIEVEYLGKTYLFIAEERLNVDTDRSVQEECYRKYTCGMDELIKQLILFIRHTRMADISWRNLPLFNDNVAKIGLVDLDRIDTSVSLGLLGKGEEPERGLLSCLFSEEQIDAVVKAVRPYDSSHKADGMKQRRLEELQREAKLQKFYLEKGLLHESRRTIDVEGWTEEDWKRLGLDLEETSKIFQRKAAEDQPSNIITLRQAVVDVINAINYAIQNAPPKASIKGTRCALLNMDDCNNAHVFEGDNERTQFLSRLADYGRRLGLRKAGNPNYQMPPEELGQYLWLDRIARALVQAGHLCYFEKKGASYILQA